MNDPAEWEAIHKSRMWGTYPDIHVVRQFKRFMAQWKEKYAYTRPHVLDIGCGTGACSFMMRDEGAVVYAIDGSETAINTMIGRMYDSEGRHRITAHIGDIQSVELSPYTFDFILDNFTLTNIKDPPWYNIMLWMNPGAWLVHSSFYASPKDSPPTWNHIAPGDEVERHEISNDHGTHGFVVRRYIKP